MPDTPVLITAADLHDWLTGDEPPVVLDVRWKLSGPPGHGEYLTLVACERAALLALGDIPQPNRPLPASR